MQQPLLIPGMYQHYKGKRYAVRSLALHSETDEWYVVYEPCYDCEVAVFVRPYALFIDQVEVGGVVQPRFQKLEEGVGGQT